MQGSKLKRRKIKNEVDTEEKNYWGKMDLLEKSFSDLGTDSEDDDPAGAAAQLVYA